MASVYKIDGTTVKAPNSIIPSDNIVSRSHEDIYAIMRDLPVRRKRKVSWVYEYITKAEFQVIYNIVWNKIKNQKTRMFNVTTEFPGEGMITSVFYLGTPTNFKSLLGTMVNGVEVWSLQLDWIEKEGLALRSPMDEQT